MLTFLFTMQKCFYYMDFSCCYNRKKSRYLYFLENFRNLTDFYALYCEKTDIKTADSIFLKITD